jgi:hypothetical protein
VPSPLDVVETAGQSAAVGNPTGGNPCTDLCPTGELLVGVSGYLSTSGWLAQIQGHCAVLGILGNDPYTVTVVSTSTTPLRGEQGDPSQPWSSVCPDGAAVVGFEGAFGSFVDSLVVYCAPIVVTAGVGGPTVALDTAQALPAAGGPGGDPFPREDCPTGEVARGVNLRTGYYVDLIQFVCGALNAP